MSPLSVPSVRRRDHAAASCRALVGGLAAVLAALALLTGCQSSAGSESCRPQAARPCSRCPGDLGLPVPVVGGGGPRLSGRWCAFPFTGRGADPQALRGTTTLAVQAGVSGAQLCRYGSTVVGAPARLVTSRALDAATAARLLTVVNTVVPPIGDRLGHMLPVRRERGRAPALRLCGRRDRRRRGPAHRLRAGDVGPRDDDPPSRPGAGAASADLTVAAVLPTADRSRRVAGSRDCRCDAQPPPRSGQPARRAHGHRTVAGNETGDEGGAVTASRGGRGRTWGTGCSPSGPVGARERGQVGGRGRPVTAHDGGPDGGHGQQQHGQEGHQPQGQHGAGALLPHHRGGTNGGNRPAASSAGRLDGRSRGPPQPEGGPGDSATRGDSQPVRDDNGDLVTASGDVGPRSPEAPVGRPR